MRNIQLMYIVLSMLAINSCKTLNTNLSIPEQKIPASFNTSTDSATIADIKWPDYFSDSLLISLIDTALSNNLDLLITLQKIEATRADVLYKKGLLSPVVDGTMWAGQERTAEYSVNWAGNEGGSYLSGDPLLPTYTDYYLGFQSSWELDIWGKLKNQHKAAVSNFMASLEGKNFVISNLVTDIAIFYYELVALDNELDIIRQTIQKQQVALEVVQLQKEVGLVNELAVQQFQAQLLNIQGLEIETLQQITEAENRINFLLGRFPQTIIRNKEALFHEIPPQIAAGIPSQLLANRPDIRRAEFQVQATKFDLKSARAAFYPKIDIIASLGFQAFNPEFLFLTPASISYSLFGGLIAPLVNRKALKAEFNYAKANQLEAMYNYQMAILIGFVEVVNELSNIHYLQQINSLKKQQRVVLENSVETSTELYKSAKANYLEVLIAQQNSLETKLDLIEVSKRQQIATVNIYKALGGGW
jgi:outer membrane protein, multidrug efflux system